MDVQAQVSIGQDRVGRLHEHGILQAGEEVRRLVAHHDIGQGANNFVAGFRVVPVSIVYIVAMIALGLHLRHGVWSMFQTLGMSHPRYIAAAHVLAWVIAIVVTVGTSSFPLAVLAGGVK